MRCGSASLGPCQSLQSNRSRARVRRACEHAEDDVIDPYADEWGNLSGALVQPEPVSDENLDELLRLLWEHCE